MQPLGVRSGSSTAGITASRKTTQTLRVILAQAALQLTNSQQERCRAVRAGYLSAMTAIMTERQALNSGMQVRICSPFLKAYLICQLGVHALQHRACLQLQPEVASAPWCQASTWQRSAVPAIP